MRYVTIVFWPVEPEIDEERAGVLCEEDCGPADLQTAVLEVQHRARVQTQRLQGVLVSENRTFKIATRVSNTG
jgi:hypothetical protein